MTYWQSISEQISHSTGKSFQITQKTPVSGGDINSAYQISGFNRQGELLHYFVKLNSADLETMFQVEYDSLNELSQNKMMRIPKAVCYGVSKDQSYLVLEYISMNFKGDSKAMGSALAQMHKIIASQYGWQHNNFIGSTPQNNHNHTDWLSFWRDERMIPQFKMLYDKGYQSYLSPLSEQLLSRLDSLLKNYNPPASLLHGDLWSGNYAYDENLKPVIFDPAIYYGDRETDLAMTELFGGFDAGFYSAYNEVLPLDEGYKMRKTLYNLYHILNHANLFGTSYLNQAINMMERLC
ncbi:MAG: fructosamine kinase family protein [gamma proteobacterium symbiont of Taylorina sp.]|nr:fructosamine kinase family protein [gamma proteobacterium symbiont of Taylorina sp.]